MRVGCKVIAHRAWAFLVLLTLTSCGATSYSPGSSPIPVFVSSPAAAADEGIPYRYTVQATNPANGSMSYQLITSPSGATMSGDTVSWTPTKTQSRRPNSFELRATTAGGASATQTWTVTPTGVIHLRWVQTFVSDDATSTAPVDMRSESLAALVPNGTGGFDRLEGQGFADGTGSIAHVPAGFFWLDQDEIIFIWTDSSTIDLSYSGSLRRADVVLNDSIVNFSVSGLNPWQPSDQLWWYVTNAGVVWQNPFDPPSPGATTLLASKKLHDQLDASRGDQQVLAQMVAHTTQGQTVWTLERAFGPTPILSFAGMYIDEPLADPPKSTFRGNFGGMAFQESVGAMNPNAVAAGTLIELRVEPGPPNHQPLFGELLLAQFELPANIDVDMGDITFGNPFPSTWPVFIRYFSRATIPYSPPGLPAGRSGAYAEGFTTKLTTADSPLRPIVGPPRNVTINGSDFFLDQSGVGLTPTLRWDPPSIGTATLYQVGFCYFTERFGSPAPSLGFNCVGSLYTGATSVSVPPGLLQINKYYLISVRSISQPGLDSSAPFRTAFPRATADALSGIITP